MFLKDGKWHNLSEIAEKCSLDEHKVEMIVSFLSQYDFTKLDKRNHKAKLSPIMLEFVHEIQRLREEEPLSP